MPTPIDGLMADLIARIEAGAPPGQGGRHGGAPGSMRARGSAIRPKRGLDTGTSA